jgi:YihY family inner membrane protein
MTKTATETHDAEPGIAGALKAKSADVLSSPYVLGGAAVGIAAAGYALLRRKKATPRAIAPKRRENRVDMLKVAGFLVSLASSLASATDHAKVDADADADADAIKRDMKALPMHAEPPPSEVKDAQPGKAVPQPPTFEQTSSSWIGRQWQICVAAANAWNDDYAPSMGAALSYYMLFSLAPLLVIVIAIAGMVFGHDAAQGAIIAQLGGIMGKEGATAVQGLLQAAHEPSTGIVASIIGGVVLLIGATAMFAELQSDLDRIWQVPAKDKPSGIWGWLRSRVLSFGLVLGVAFMLMISLVVSAALAASGEWLGGGSGAESVIANVLNFIASLAIFTLLFAMIYKIMPSAKISWHDVWMGSAVTALLFNVGKSLIGLYLAKSSVASGFGAAGSIVFLVAWFYYSAQIFLFGAEYTWVYANSKGRKK